MSPSAGSVDGKRVYGKTMNGLIIAVDADAPEYRSLWNVDAKFGYEHNPCPLLEHDGIVFAGSRQGILAAVDAGTRRLLWTYKCWQLLDQQDRPPGPDGGIWVTLIEGKFTVFSGMGNEKRKFRRHCSFGASSSVTISLKRFPRSA